jgi:hypothetical protein
MRTATLTLIITQAMAVTSFAQVPTAGNLGLKDTEFVVRLNSPISTKGSQKGDAFSAQVLSPAQYSAGIVEGHIRDVKIAKKRDKANISFTFETLSLNGQTYMIKADLKEVSNSKGVKRVDEEGRAIGTSSKKKKVAGALVGAGLGAAIGALAGGASGAAAGGAIGAGAGLLLAVGLTTSGANVEFAPGSQFTLAMSDRRR